MSSSVEELQEYIRQLIGKVDQTSISSVLYAGLAENYLKLGLKNRCTEIMAEALKAVDRVKMPEEKSIRLSLIGRILHRCGDMTAAKDAFTRAVLLARATQTTAERTGALYRLASEYVEINAFDEAEKVLEEIRETALSMDGSSEKAVELIGAAEFYSEMGQKDKALKILSEAAEITEAIDDDWFRTERLLEMAEAYEELKEDEKSFEAAAQALDTADEIDETNRLDFYLRISDIYSNAGKKAEVKAVLASALGIVNVNRDSPTIIGDSLDIAGRYFSNGNQSEAESLLTLVRENIEIQTKAEDKISGRVSLGEFLITAERQQEAIQEFSKAFENIEQVFDGRSRIYLLGKIAANCFENGNPELGSKAIEKAVESVSDKKAKTGGIGSIIADLAELNEYDSALKLAVLVTQKNVKAEALNNIVSGIIESGQDRSAEIREFLNNTVD